MDELNKSIDVLWRAGKFAEAVEPPRQAAAICEKALGPDHWRTAEALRKVETQNTIAGLPEEGRRALMAVPVLEQEFMDAYGKARYADAERLVRQLMDVRRRWLDEGHLDTATSYSNLAVVCHARGKLTEAEEVVRRALAIQLEALGEIHPDTASGCDNLAAVLYDQGKLVEAEAMHRHALAIWIKALGEGHPDTAISYNNLASVLLDREGERGRPARAEPGPRRADQPPRRPNTAHSG